MFKKSLIIFLIISLLGINFSNILTVKAQNIRTEDIIQKLPPKDFSEIEMPSASSMEPVLLSAPESFNVSLAQILVCNSGIYDFLANLLDSLKQFISSGACTIQKWAGSALEVVGGVIPVVGGLVSGLGTQMKESSPTCTIDLGGAGQAQECKKWVQQREATIKAKMAEMKKILLRSAAKAFTDHLVYDIVDWIGGEQDRPQFITNWQAFFSEVTDDAVGRFIENSDFSKLCEPIRFSVQLQLQTPSIPGRPTLPTCTLSDVVNNIESFYEDFNNGGWFAFEEASYPWNNSIGAMLMVNDNLVLEIEQAKEAAEKETQSGYEPTKYCVETKFNENTGEIECVKEVISIPGDVKSAMTSKAVTQELDKPESYFLTQSDLDNYGKLISNALIKRLIQIVKESELIGNKSYSQGLLAGNFLKRDATPVVTSLKIKYICKNYDGKGVCEPASDDDKNVYDVYGSKDACEAACGSDDATLYKCNTNSGECSVCSENEYCTYTLATCKSICEPFKSPSPTSSVSPSPTSTPSVKYLCYNEACYISDKGEFSTKDECDHYCEELNPLERWSCDKNLGSCVKSFDGKGDYIFENTCNSYCKPSTPPLSYNCDHVNHACIKNYNGGGEFSNYGDCYDACLPASLRFSCNNGECVHDSNGISLTNCQISCPLYPYITRFACNESLGLCVPDNNGTSIKDCDRYCPPLIPSPSPSPSPTPSVSPSPTPSRRYSCYNQTCSVNNNGEFSNFDECYNVCLPPDERFSCDNGECVPDVNGTSRINCERFCF